MTRRRRGRQPFDIGRLLAGVAASFGLLALVLSFYDPIIGASEPIEFAVDELPELQEQAQASQLKAAAPAAIDAGPASDRAAASASVPPSPTAQPKPVATPRKEAPPLEALPASRVRSVGVNQGRSAPASSQTAFTGPLSVALVALDSGAVEGVVERVASQLRASNRDVKVTSLDAAGRPDVLLVLDASGSSRQAWYCDPGPAGNATLARLLLAGLPTGASIDGSPGLGLESTFSCEEVHAGRAQTAAVLLQLPVASGSIDEAAAAIGAALNRYLDDNATALRQARGRASLIWPATGPITSHFGAAHPLGIDIGQWEGSIVAAAEGKVVFAGGNACCSYGLYVVIESAGGMHTLYAHFNRIDVRMGQAVRQGQPLGLVGCTGHCEGNHLHFEVFQNGSRINPMLYLP